MALKPDKSKETPGEAGPSIHNLQLTRRKFLGTAAAIGGTALVASYPATSAAREFKGWPEGFGCLTDLSACVGCRSCEAACNKQNNLPAPKVDFDDKTVFNEQRRPTTSAYTVVNQYKNPKDAEKPIYRKVQCNHCLEPACATACPVHAYSKTPEGAVLYDVNKCFGCRYCMVACPFLVPAYDYESALEPKIVKCVMCHDKVVKGGIPACAEACPVGAITFGKRDDLITIAREKIKNQPDRYIHHIYGEHEVGGTSWMYISGVPFEQIGFPTNLPETPLLEQTKGFLSTVPLVFTVWPALFGMCYAALRHREGNDEEVK